MFDPGGRGCWREALPQPSCSLQLDRDAPGRQCSGHKGGGWPGPGIIPTRLDPPTTGTLIGKSVICWFRDVSVFRRAGIRPRFRRPQLELPPNRQFGRLSALERAFFAGCMGAPGGRFPPASLGEPQAACCRAAGLISLSASIVSFSSVAFSSCSVCASRSATSFMPMVCANVRMVP
jgi:hypothetical protein